MIRIAERHLGSAAGSGMLLALLVLLGLDAFFAVIGEFGEIGRGRYDVTHALGYVALTMPRRAYDLFPVATVVGAMLGVGGMAASSELIAYRAAGMSRLRIAAGVVLTTALLLVPVLLLGEAVAPTTERMAQALRVGALTNDMAVAGDESIWVRDGQRFINARRPLASSVQQSAIVRLADIDIFQFENGALSELSHAELARHEGDTWVLEGIRRSILGAEQVRVETAEQETWSSLINPRVLATAVARPRHLSMAELGPYIDYLQRNDLNAASYRAAFWLRAAYPLTALVVVLAGMVFVFGSLRGGSLGQRLFLGMLLGVGFYLANRIAVNLGEVYGLDPVLMAFAPSLVLASVSVWALRRGT